MLKSLEATTRPSQTWLAQADAPGPVWRRRRRRRRDSSPKQPMLRPVPLRLWLWRQLWLWRERRLGLRAHGDATEAHELAQVAPPVCSRSLQLRRLPLSRSLRQQLKLGLAERAGRQGVVVALLLQSCSRLLLPGADALHAQGVLLAWRLPGTAVHVQCMLQPGARVRPQTGREAREAVRVAPR